MKYYKVTVKYNRESKYTFVLKANGLDDTDVIAYCLANHLFQDDSDADYVKEILTISRKEYEKLK